MEVSGACCWWKRLAVTTPESSVTSLTTQLGTSRLRVSLCIWFVCKCVTISACVCCFHKEPVSLATPASRSWIHLQHLSLSLSLFFKYSFLFWICTLKSPEAVMMSLIFLSCMFLMYAVWQRPNKTIQDVLRACSMHIILQSILNLSLIKLIYYHLGAF